MDKSGVRCGTSPARGDPRSCGGDIVAHVVVERVEHRTLVADTDDGADIRRRVEDLEQLLEAYRDGQIAEGVR